ncbi:MAG TPA: hypothetical protein VIH59_08810 [Candidatus Tectomicrobia bacterium]|jgi:hypothetical protein
MRVLLSATNQADRYIGRLPLQPLPVGLAYVAAHLDTARHSLPGLDLMCAADAIQDTVTAVQHFQPDVIGLALRNLDNQSYLLAWPGVSRPGHTVVRQEHFPTQFQMPPHLDLLDLQHYNKAGFGIGVVNKLAPYSYAPADGQGQGGSAD